MRKQGTTLQPLSWLKAEPMCTLTSIQELDSRPWKVNQESIQQKLSKKKVASLEEGGWENLLKYLQSLHTGSSSLDRMLNTRTHVKCNIH